MALSTTLELCNHCCSAINQIHVGEHVIVTQSGQPVAELRPLRRRNADPATLLHRWRHLPHLSPDKLRRDIDGILDPSQ